MMRILNAASVCGAIVMLGCGGQQPADPPKQKPKTEVATVAKADPAKETKKPVGLPDDHDHGAGGATNTASRKRSAACAPTTSSRS